MGFKRNMNITNISNQTFNGYKNLIADHSKVGDAESATIIMQLDNLGTNDLEKYEELKQMLCKNKQISYPRSSPNLSKQKI